MTHGVVPPPGILLLQAPVDDKRRLVVLIYPVNLTLPGNVEEDTHEGLCSFIARQCIVRAIDFRTQRLRYQLLLLGSD